MFILTRWFRQARIKTYSNTEISTYCQGDRRFARFTYMNHRARFEALSYQQKAQIVQAHSADTAFFKDIGLPLLLERDDKKYPVFKEYRDNFIFPQTRKPWYKRWFSFGNKVPDHTLSALAFMQQHATDGAIDLAVVIKSTDLHKNAEAEVMAQALKDTSLIESSWNDLVELAKKNITAARHFLQSEAFSARFSESDFSDYNVMYSALDLYDQFADIVSQHSELRPEVQSLQKTIEKNLLSILDLNHLLYQDAMAIHQRPCWKLIKDSPALISHRNNPLGVKIQELLAPVAVRTFGRSATPEPERLIGAMVDLTLENCTYAQQLLSHTEASKHLSEKQALQILSAHTNNVDFLNSFLAPNKGMKQPLINLHALVMQSKDAADIMIKNSEFIRYLSLNQLQALKDRFYSQLDRSHFLTLGLNDPNQQTAKDVKRQYHRLSLRYHSDKSQGKGGDDVMQRKLNNARDELKPLEHIECIDNLLAKKREEEQRAAALSSSSYGRFYLAPKTDLRKAAKKEFSWENLSKP